MVKLGIIGCGAITAKLHLPAAKRARGIEVVALVDAVAQNASDLAAEFRIPHACTRLDDCPQIDGVLIATPPHARVDIVNQAARLGWHILAEKPLGNSTKDCRTQIEATQRAGVTFAAGHVYRFWPSRERIRELILNKTHGELLHIECTQGQPYSWKSVTGYTMLRSLVPGGVLINAGIHPLDTLIWWNSDPITFEYWDDAIGGLESNYLLRMKFSDGSTADLKQSRTTVLANEIWLTFENAKIRLPTYSRDHYYYTDQNKTEKVQVCSPLSEIEPATRQLEDFAAAIEERRPPKVTGPDGTRVIELIEKCYLAKKGRPLPRKAPTPGDVW